jgi:hypothetical protein
MAMAPVPGAARAARGAPGELAAPATRGRVARPRRVRDPFATRQRGLTRTCSHGARCFGMARRALGVLVYPPRRGRLPPCVFHA